MSKRVIKYKSELKFLGRCLPGTARLLFKHAPSSFVLAIVDVVWTTLTGKVPLSPRELTAVRSVQPALRRIASREQTVAERRRALLTQGGVKAVQTLFRVIRKHF